MKVLLYSHSFDPSIGGLETVSMTLAEGFLKKGIDIKVVTKSLSNGETIVPFEVVRNPDLLSQFSLIKWADVILFNGATLALQPWIMLLRKPFVWVHIGYQVSCIDGLGWVDGKPAPLKPFSSFLYHKRISGWSWAIKHGLKLIIRRSVAKYFVTKNIAITKWMYSMQPLPRQVHIYNPFPLNKFAVAPSAVHEYDFFYLGRIVSEKGVLTLLNAFSLVHSKNQSIRLLIIGDGNFRENIELAVKKLKLSGAITFGGSRTGSDLIHWISKAKIAIIPSEWYEAMGGVALELMAAGKNMIISDKGGMKECVGNAALTFSNGDHQALAKCMIQLLDDTCLRDAQLEQAKERVKFFSPERFVNQYIDLLKTCVKSNVKSELVENYPITSHR